jgi:outer membrane protein assembly factor BamB
LVEDGKAIIAPGGDMMMIAVDCNSGEVLWERPNEHGWAMTHASIIPMEFAGKRMYVYCSDGGTVGVSAEDGSLLWETDKWELRTIVPSPVIVGGNRIFLSAGYEKGSMMLELKEESERIEAEVLFTLDPEKFGATQQSPVYYDGFIYGIRPDEELVCLDPAGNIIWRSTPNNKFGLGPLMIADGLIYAMNDDGVLTMAEATSSGYVELGEAKVLDGHESWGPMAIAGGRLIVRDLTRMVCLDVSQH